MELKSIFRSRRSPGAVAYGIETSAFGPRLENYSHRNAARHQSTVWTPEIGLLLELQPSNYRHSFTFMRGGDGFLYLIPVIGKLGSCEAHRSTGNHQTQSSIVWGRLRFVCYESYS
eukprot:2416115-Pyramimonas_sp.AAC.1